MVSAVRPPTTRSFIDQSMDGAIKKAEEQLTAEGLLEEMELDTERHVAGLPSEMPDNRRQQIVQLINGMGKLVSCMSAEACKEDHATFIQAVAKVKELATSADSLLIVWEMAIKEQQVEPRPGLLSRLAGLLFERTNKADRRRELELETINRFRDQIDRLRKQPGEYYEAAIQHVKRMLLYDRADYQEAQRTIVRSSKELEQEQDRQGPSKIYYKIAESIKGLREMLARIDAECYDRALQQIQDSDNGPRP